MDRICVLMGSSDLLLNNQIYVQEFGFIGMGIGDETNCYTYNLHEIIGASDNPVVRAIALDKNGMSLDYHPDWFAWFEVFEHVRKVWQEYKSDKRPCVGLIGMDILEKYLNEYRIETVDLFDLGLPTDLKVVPQEACSAHDAEHWDCCMAARLASVRRWCQSQ